PAFDATTPITLTISGVILTNNRSTGNGGGIALANGATAPVATDIIATITGGNVFKRDIANLLGDSIYINTATVNGFDSTIPAQATQLLASLLGQNPSLLADDIWIQ